MQIDSRKAEIEQLHSKREKINKERSEIEAAVAQILNKFDQAVKTYDDNKNAYTILLNDMQSAQIKSQQIHSSLAKQETTKRDLEVQLSLLKGALSKQLTDNEIVSGLKEAQRLGFISGFYGRLGHLGTIDSKYDVAVTTAGAHLDSLVVENTSSAEACVSFIKEKGYGRAQFICLDRVKEVYSRKMAEPFECPPQTQRLFDLITADEEQFKIAFYFALGNTLCCEDQKSGTTIQ